MYVYGSAYIDEFEKWDALIQASIGTVFGSSKAFIESPCRWILECKHINLSGDDKSCIVVNMHITGLYKYEQWALIRGSINKSGFTKLHSSSSN